MSDGPFDYNPYEDGSAPHGFIEVSNKLAKSAATGDATADAIDRLTIALYRIAAAATYRMGDRALAEEVEGIKYALSEIAESITPAKGSAEHEARHSRVLSPERDS